jgi:hypothetical protein
MANEKLQMAGYTDANGDLGRPVPSGHILVPGQIWLEGDAIRWKLAGHAKSRQPSRAMLTEFVALHQANPEMILRFARDWGVLMLTGGKTPRPCGEAMAEGVEPIEAWQYFSRRAAAVLNIAAALKDGKLGDLTDWGVLAALKSGSEAADKASLKVAIDRHKYGLGFLSDIPRGTERRSAIDQGRDLLAQEIGQWLGFWKAGRMRGLSDFSLRWSSNAQKWELQIEYQGYLFAALALQLTLVVAEADSLYTCSACGLPYIRTKKRPKVGWANYCDACIARGIGARRAVESYRKRKIEARRLAAEGVPLAEIAAKVNSDPETVKGWLRKRK